MRPDDAVTESGDEVLKPAPEFAPIETPPEKPEGAPRGGPETFRCGSLIYSKRGLLALFGWMLWGDFCFTLMETVVPTILPLKLQHGGATNATMGLILTTIPGILNLTITPWLSFKSDRHRSRWGRRLPFILGTMPFLVISLILMGLSGNIGGWVQAHFIPGNAAARAHIVIVMLALFAVMFQFFNMFVNTVYWYLFNDVIPQELMGRFFGWFRVVGTLTSAAYQFFVFQYSESHTQAIFIGAGLIYLVGFGMMRLRVKEGEYPPPPDDGEHAGLMSQIRLFAKESFRMRYYWDHYLAATLPCIGGCIVSISVIFANLSMGLNYKQMGWYSGTNLLLSAVVIAFSGYFVDRWHTVKASAYFAVFDTFNTFGLWIWMFILKPPVMMWMWLAIITNLLFNAPRNAIRDTAGQTRLMAMFPKEEFGQFSGAMCLVRALGIIIGGILAGFYIDVLRHYFPGGALNPDGTPVNPTSGYYVYRLWFIWAGIFNIMGFYFYYRTYRVWKRLGGVKHYVPPMTNVLLKDLKPYPGDDGKVLSGPILVSLWAVVGGTLAGFAWMAYYIWWEPNVKYQIVLGVSIVTSILIFLAGVRFIKFMERP